MKQYIVTLLLIVCVSLQLSAQKKKRTWGEVNFAVEQNFMFPKQFDDSEINKMIPNLNIQYFMLGVDVRIVDEFGVFFNYGFGIRKYHKGFADDYNVFDKINFDEYNIDDLENKKDKTINGKMSLGFFYRIHQKD